MRQIIVLCLLCSCLLVGCSAPQSPREMSWRAAMASKLADYTTYSREELTPYFNKANLPYAPRDLAFLIFKKSKKFEMYARNNSSEKWRYIKTFPIYAASGGAGPKLHEGDRQVPEGIYHIIGLNPRSHFDLSMHLNYPNAFDKQHAKLDHRSQLGGNIFIHGNRRSIGCVAIGDDAIQQIFPLVYAVGEHHVTVVIAPNDLRKYLPVPSVEHEKWMSTLYARLRNELNEFPIV